MNTVLGQSPLVTLILAAVVGILAAGRITRLVVDDKFPPMVRLRGWWDVKTDYADDNPGWGLLLHCPWCFGMYATAFVGLTGWASNLHVAWWVFHGWLAASYVVSYLVFHDED